MAGSLQLARQELEAGLSDDVSSGAARGELLTSSRPDGGVADHRMPSPALRQDHTQCYYCTSSAYLVKSTDAMPSPALRGSTESCYKGDADTECCYKGDADTEGSGVGAARAATVVPSEGGGGGGGRGGGRPRARGGGRMWETTRRRTGVMLALLRHAGGG